MMMKNPSCGEVQGKTWPHTLWIGLPKTKDEFFKNNTESHGHSKSQRMQIGKRRLAGMRIPFKIARADAQIG